MEKRFNEDQDEIEIDLRELLFELKRRWWILLAGADSGRRSGRCLQQLCAGTAVYFQRQFIRSFQGNYIDFPGGPADRQPADAGL